MIEDNNNYWKQRAIDRRMENKAVKKRVKELTISRDGWKIKYMKTKEEKVFFEKELKAIKKKLNEIIRI